LAALPVLAGSLTGRIELESKRKGRDYSGVVVWLEPVANVSGRMRTEAGTFKMIQRGKTFTPHILAIPLGSTVEFPNSDPIFHNAFSNFNGQIFDVGLYPPGSSRNVVFRREGIVRVFCNIHPTMSAVIVVLGTPYFATSARNGGIEIPSVPDGEYHLRVFHERATPETLSKLERRITISGPSTLAPIVISEAGYIPVPHKNKFGKEYPPVPDDRNVYPGVKQ
jgi:plastocyanin